MKYIAVFVCLMSFLTVPLTAQPKRDDTMKVSDLMGFCKANDELSQTACRFYIFGAMEGLKLGADYTKRNAHFCVPDGISVYQVKDLVVRVISKELAAYPADADLQAVGVVGAVLEKSYPCNN